MTLMHEKYQKLAAFEDDPVYSGLSPADRDFIGHFAGEYRLTVQEIKILCDIAADLDMWGAGPLERWWQEPDPGKFRGRERARQAVDAVRSTWERLKAEGPMYDGSERAYAGRRGIRYRKEPAAGSLMGRCPVASPRTRCCNLLTLDAVLGCGYGCSYCSIQTFAGSGEIIFRSDLRERLMEIALDPGQVYHVGTGQSSDSLMFGNREGLLDHLFAFAARNPNVILELKTKSAVVQPLIQAAPPATVIAGWTLNPQVVVTAEEPLSASLQDRLSAARKAADNGIAVGFHFHPIVPFRGWEEAYGNLYREVLHTFSPEEVVMVSFGTVTLLRPVIRFLRTRRYPSKILKLPLVDAAGKLSIPLEMKQRLFSHAYRAFEPWQAKVFFYLCMEDPSLWAPVFGYGYETNEEFESAMKSAYAGKLSDLSAGAVLGK